MLLYISRFKDCGEALPVRHRDATMREIQQKKDILYSALGSQARASAQLLRR